MRYSFNQLKLMFNVYILLFNKIEKFEQKKLYNIYKYFTFFFCSKEESSLKTEKRSIKRQVIIVYIHIYIFLILLEGALKK